MAEHDLPDLAAVDKAIHEAHVAENRLMQMMPNAIDPHDDDYPGDVPVDADTQEAEAEMAEEPAPPQQTGTEEIEDKVFGTQTSDGQDAGSEPQDG
ncbi:MAG: hypothetical protein M3Y06_06830 [Actinomycetota bacterium]|nr:hypothetical protein [Actinomycetota bacterium]